MPVVADFSGVDAKLARANTHLETIEKEITTFIGSDPYGFVGEYDIQTGEIVVKPVFKIHPDKDLWATIIGDCVHNLRASLDHLAHQLLRLAGGVPKVGRGGTAFPIFDSNTGPKGGNRTVGITGVSGKVGGHVLAFVEGVQPYERINEIDLHPLWILSELDNMDKHRELALTSLALDDFSLGIGSMGDLDFTINRVGFTGPFNEKTEVTRITATVTGPNPHMEMYPDGTPSIAFDASNGVAPNRPVLSTLTELSQYVANIVVVLKALAINALKP